MSRGLEKKARVGLKAWLRSRDERSAVRCDDESGNTLIEVLLTTIIVGLASVAIMTSFATSITASAEHRSLATFDNMVVLASQEAVSEIQQNLNLFTCPMSLASYQGFVPLSLNALNATGYTAQITSVKYWNVTGTYAGQFTPTTGGLGSTCVANEPQQITVQVTSSAVGSAPVTNVFDVADPLNVTTTTASSATQLVFTTQPGNGAAGVALSQQPVVYVEDSSGNLVTTDLSPVTLSLTSGGGILTSCSGSESGGKVTFSGCTVSSSGTYTLTASDVTLPLVNGQPYTSAPSNSFTISGAPPSLVFVTQPVAGLSGGVMSTQPKIEIENNVAGVWVLDPITATVTLTASGGVLAGCANLTAVLGVVNVSGCTFAGLVGTYYALEATSSGLVPVQSNAISPSGAGTATRIAFTTQTSGVANSSLSAVFTTQPVVTATDSAGNVATGYSTAITLSMTGGGTLSCSNKVVTPSSGVASYSGCHGSPVADAIGVTLTATSGALTTTSASFNITGVASALVFTTQPAAGASGTSLATQPVVAFEDATGSIVTAMSATITLATTLAGPAGGTLSFCTGLSTATGVATVASCAFAGLVGTNYTLTASATGVTSAISAVITPTGPGAASKLVVTSSPVAGASGSVFTTQPIVKVEDTGGNVVTSSATTVTLTASGGTLAGCNNLVAVAGFVNAANCTFAGLDAAGGGSYTITASASSLTSGTSSAFSPSGPGPASQVLLSGCSSGVVYASTCSITGTVVDAAPYDNVVTSYTGNITFAQASGNGGLSVLPSAVPAVSGVASLTVTGSAVGTLGITATSAAPALTSLPLSVTVAQEVLTASVTASNKTYNSTTSATIATCTLSPAPTGITCAAASASFSQSNVGNSLGVTASGITLSGIGVANYILASTSATTTANITTAALTVTASSATVSYGATVPTITASYSGFVNGETSGNLTGQPGCITAYTTSSAAGTTPSTSCSGAVDANYTITYVAGSITVNQAALTITASSPILTYGAGVPTITASYSGFMNGQSAASLSTQPGCITAYTTSSAAGTTPSTSCSGAVDANYTINYVSGVVTVNKATVTITASATTNTYGTAPGAPTASFSGFMNSQTSSVLTTQPTCSTTVTATTAAGAPTGTSTCSGAAAANYTFTYVAGNATVNKAGLTITASATTNTYGTTPGVPTASFSGFVNSQTSSALTTQPGCTTTVTATTAAGSYTGTSTCSGAVDSNYTITYVAGNATVNQAALTITASSTTLTYGAAVPTITASYSGFVNSQTSSALTTQPGCITAYITSSAAGTTPSTSCSGAVDANYTITYVAGTVTVNKATVTITASATTNTYGTAPGVPTASFSGFMNSQTSSVLTTQPTCSTTVTATTAAGSHTGTSTCSSAAAANYTFAYVAGNATVNQAALTITASSATLTYGSAVPTITASYSGFVNSQTSSALTTQPGCITAYTTSSAAGTTPSTSCSGAVDANYTFTYVAGTVTVNQANQAALTLTPTTGLRTGVTIGTSGGSGSGAVSYSVTTGTASNCAINSNSGVLTATTSGTCLVTATKAASTDYLSATTGAVTVTLSNAGTYSGSNSDLPSGTGDYFAINTLNSVGSTTSTANPTTPGVTEHLTGLTFTIDASSSQTHSATVGIITSGVWAPTALTCTIAANSGLTSCTVSGSVNVPVGSSINVLVVSGSIAHIGTWSTTWTQP